MRKLMRVLITILILTAALSGCNTKKNAPVKGSQFLLDTIIEITLYDEENLAKALLDQLFQEIQNSENKYSRHIEGSEVSMVNCNLGTPVAVSEDTLDLVQKSLYFSSLSNGLFDVSIGPLVDLWDISGEKPRVPPQSEINAALDKIDYHKVKVDKEKGTILIPGSGMSLDVGAIAKGYITDNLVRILRDKGISSALLNLGGNLYLLGSKTDGTAWNVGIRNPYGLQGDYIGLVSVKDTSVVTSGIYERYFDENGKRYHHILNPKTGWPEENNLASVAIVCPSSATADGLSTTVFLLGLEKGMELIESQEDTEAILVTKDKKIYLSSGIRNGQIPFELTNREYTIVK